MDFHVPGLGYLRADQAFTLIIDGDERQFPANWLRRASAEDLSAIVAEPVVFGPKPDERFYLVEEVFGGANVTYVGTPRPLDDQPVVDQDGQPVFEVLGYDASGEPIHGTQLVAKGLKSQMIAAAKETAAGLLAQTDWMVVRAMEDPAKPVPAEIAAHRAAIREASNTYETAVLACTTVDQLAGVAPPAWPTL